MELEKNLERLKRLNQLWDEKQDKKHYTCQLLFKFDRQVIKFPSPNSSLAWK